MFPKTKKKIKYETQGTINVLILPDNYSNHVATPTKLFGSRFCFQSSSGGRRVVEGFQNPLPPLPLKQDANEQVERWQAGGGGGGAISYERCVAGSDRVKQETRR